MSYRREWSFDSEAETPTTTFNTKLLHTTLRACLFGEKGGKKGQQLDGNRTPILLWEFDVWSPQGAYPNREQKHTNKRETQKEEAVPPFSPFPFLPFYILPFYLFPFFTPYPFYPFTLFYSLPFSLPLPFFYPCRHFYPRPFTFALCSTTQKERSTSRSSSFWSGRLCVLSLAEFPSVFGWCCLDFFVS